MHSYQPIQSRSTIVDLNSEFRWGYENILNKASRDLLQARISTLKQDMTASFQIHTYFPPHLE